MNSLTLLIAIILADLIIGQTGRCAERLAIRGAGTDNPVLTFGGHPMFKTGPISEDRVFMYQWGSPFFDHASWLDYMKEYEFQFARVYAAHTWHEDQLTADHKPLYPFPVVRFTSASPPRPMVNLLKTSDEYWKNFAKVLTELEQRDIVVCIQLYQRWYWGNKATRSRLFFHRDNNVNGIHAVNPKTVWSQMSDAKPDGIMWTVHRNYLLALLNAIGNHQNVVIDLMNESSIKQGMTKEWINGTLDIIERWERERGRNLLVGMDIDHFLQANEDSHLQWLLEHPRLELIVAEDKWIYQRWRDVVRWRQVFGKPVIWVNEKAVGYMDTYSITDHPNRRLHYLWLGLMLKVQGLGFYEKENHTALRLLETPQAKQMGEYNRTLMKFVNNDISDYALLRVHESLIKKAPKLENVLALRSPQEAIVYLHKGFNQNQQAGATLALHNLQWPSGQDVFVKILYPNTGKSHKFRTQLNKSQLAITLPAFNENLVVAVQRITGNDT